MITVMRGEGKGWAKGRTASSDERVRRNAQSRQGLIYVRHLHPSDDRRYRAGSPRTLPLEWSETMAYLVGLMATDGGLSSDRRHVTFDSGDEDLVKTFLGCLGRQPVYRIKRSETGDVSYQAQFSDVRFYRWLRSIGIHPRKSLTIGAIDAPDDLIGPLARGLFEGDGHISNFVHAPTRSAHPDYLYERLWVYFNCASRSHLDWLKAAFERTLGIFGYIERRPPTDTRKEFFRLKFGNHDSVTLLRAMYPNADVPKLERKWRIWHEYKSRKGLTDCAEGGI